MNTRVKLSTDVVRPIALALVFTTSGVLVALVVKVAFDLRLTRLATSAITFALAFFAAFLLFPRTLKQPFGNIDLHSYLVRLGFYLPRGAWKHVLLGSLLAALTLCGMLVGSLLTGRYTFNPDTVDVTQILFSINPGVWEEFFFRGVVMFICIRLTASIKHAALLQILIFGFAHVKGLDPWAWIDAISVMIIAVAFTYAAWKTHTLIAGIVFHFLHDAFLFVPQLPETETSSTAENLAFYGFLWLAVGLGVVVVKVASERFHVSAEEELYTLEKVIPEPKGLQSLT